MKIILKLLATVFGIGVIFACIGAYEMTKQINSLIGIPLMLFIFYLIYKPKKKKATNLDLEITGDSLENVIGYIETDNVITKTDNSPIADEEIPYLIAKSFESALKNEKLNRKFSRTEREEDLSFNFSENHAEKLKELEDNIYHTANSIGSISKKNLKISSENEIQDIIYRCQISIDAFEKCKKFCYGKGKGGTIYFQDMWELCHNSKNLYFSYIDSTIILKSQLEELIKK